MGSAGSSKFTDYPEQAAKKVTSGGGRGGVSGGSSGQNPCDLAFSAVLEDFERSEFHANHEGTLPKVGTEVTIEKGKRIVARASSGETIGNLPTDRNYLAGCIASGRTYVGRITKVTGGAVAKITIDAAPQ